MMASIPALAPLAAATGSLPFGTVAPQMTWSLPEIIAGGLALLVSLTGAFVVRWLTAEPKSVKTAVTTARPAPSPTRRATNLPAAA